MKTLYAPIFLSFLLLTSCFTVRVAEDRSYRPTPRYTEPTPQVVEPVEVIVAAEEPIPAPTIESVDHYEEYRRPNLPVNQDRIQIALILDTSGSMDDLLEHAKLEFWYIVDELMAVYDDYDAPLLEIALYEYGNKYIGYADRHIRQVVPLTTDLDWIADELWQLHSKGSVEYDGLVIDRAVHELNWSYNPRDMKLIYIIGNETFRDGPVDPYRAIDLACQRGIEVHALFCGGFGEGINLGWEDATLCGSYSALDYHAPVEGYVSVYDNQICALNYSYNETFIPYGDGGRSAYDRCVRQDNYLNTYGPAWLSVRTAVKTGSFYSNPQWDLVDAIDQGQVDLRTLPRSQWPDMLEGMTVSEAISFVDDKRRKRAALSREIQALNHQRRASVRQRQASAPSAQKEYRSIDRAVVGSVKNRVTGIQPEPRTPSKEEVIRDPRTETDRLRDVQVQREREVEIRRQREIERKKREAEEARREAQLQREREMEIRRQREIERKRREAEASAREAQIQRDRIKREAEAAAREAQLQREREVEIRRQREIEHKKREAEEAAREARIQQQREVEARRQREQEQQLREAEARRQRQQEQQQREAEARRQREQEQQRREAEARRQREQEQQQREAEARRQREQEQQRREAEARRQREQEQQRREAEARRQREQEQQQREAEARRQREQEQQRREAEARRQREQEQQRREAEARRQREQEQQRREAEARRQRQQEQQRREAEARRQQQLEQQKRQSVSPKKSGIR